MSINQEYDQLKIDRIETPLGGTIGLSQCPGRTSVDITGKRWNHDLDHDIETIKQSGFRTVISLLSETELKHHGAGEIRKKLNEAGINWYQFPIADFDIPTAEVKQTLECSIPKLLSELESRHDLLIHCAGGLGRTGMMSAVLLVAMGKKPEEAIAIVRKARPGSIETPEQEAFVKNT